MADSFEIWWDNVGHIIFFFLLFISVNNFKSHVITKKQITALFGIFYSLATRRLNFKIRFDYVDHLRLQLRFASYLSKGLLQLFVSWLNWPEGPSAYSLFWLLVASLVRGTAMPLMQCPYYRYTGAHFTNLRRLMTGCGVWWALPRSPIISTDCDDVTWISSYVK